LIVPDISCASDVTIPLGTPWDFSGPVYSDTNLIVEVLSTTTNALCGQSYSATRQWLLADTNGYQAPCSQTVTVLDPAAPVFSCPTNKSAIYGSTWDFDVPRARESDATEAVVYDSLTNGPGPVFDPGSAEVGNQVTLAGTERYLSRFSVGYWGTNAAQPDFAGPVSARVRFYYNNGPTPATIVVSPAGVFYDSGPIPITATNHGELTLDEFQLTAAVPLVGALPSSFTWTIRFEGLGDQDAAGLAFYPSPSTGQVADGYWIFETNNWTLGGTPGQSFGSRMSALSRGVSLSVAGTVTNVVCARTFTTTRTWQALDSCSNAAICSQTVTVVDESAPVVVTQPQDELGVVGRNVSLAVDASTCPPTTYQWYIYGTNAIAEGTNAILTFTNVTFDLAGLYEVVIVNPYGSITSAPAMLSVAEFPAIQSQPTDLTVYGGGIASFTVSATGVPEPSYQWMFNDTNPIVGATNSTLVLTNAQEEQAGFYSVIVSNTAGALVSSNALLTVLAAPLITSQPQNVTALQGQSIFLTVSAIGPGPLSYQWMANCTRPIFGATSPTLRLKSVSPSDSGGYCVVVSNSFGLAFSQTAVLRVLAQVKLSSFSLNPGGASLSFSTVTNLLYTVYASDTAAGTNWIVLPNAYQQLGSGSPMTVTDPAATGSQRFYKIMVQ
jgi:hypothetical protein